MSLLNSHAVFAGIFGGLVLAGVTGLAPDRSGAARLGDEFVEAIGAHRTALIDLYLNEHRDPNARTLKTSSKFCGNPGTGLANRPSSSRSRRECRSR